jgi:hypothetical protein
MFMKGPGGRTRFDLRRVWECPLCHRRDWTTGDIVFRACNCLAKTEPDRISWMKLVEREQALPVPHAETTIQPSEAINVAHAESTQPAEMNTQPPDRPAAE